MYHVPVVNCDNEPLMPTTIRRARRWINERKATPFYRKGIFCIRLNYKKEVVKQEIAIGIDPGSKQEGYTVKSESHTYLNLQADAITWVKDAVESRRNCRKARRFRKTPCRKPRFNRSIGGLAPSIKARWDWKLRIINWLQKIFPISHYIVEDIKARTTGQRQWDETFSLLQTGKTYFYSKLSNLTLKEGWETKNLRDSLGLKKLSNKMSKNFHAHCVDSWVLANFVVGGHIKPDNKVVHSVRPLRFHRRQLHMMTPAKGEIRRSYGGTRSLGFKRGSLVKNKKYGLTYVGGTSKNRITLYSLKTSERLSWYIRIEDCKFICYNSCILNKVKE